MQLLGQGFLEDPLDKLDGPAVIWYAYNYQEHVGSPTAMTTTTWLAGFAVFLLFLFHLSLFVSFRSRFHQWLSIGWFGNCLYLYLEYHADKGHTSPESPYLFASFLLVFFVLADRDLRGTSLASTGLILIVGLSLVVLPGSVLYKTSGSFLAYTIGGALFSSLVFIRLGYSLGNLDLPDLRHLFLRDTDNILYGRSSNDQPMSRFVPVDASVRELEKKAVRTAAAGKLVLATGFMGFGLLQLAYPFREAIIATSRSAWVGLFVVGMALKLSTGAGFVVLLASHTRWLEILKRKAALSEELARITASVEHDMRGPIGELNTIIVHLEERAREGHPRYGSFLLEQARYLAFIQAKIRTVMEMILAMRESPEEFERRRQIFSLGDPLKQAMNSVKILHEQASPVIKTEGFNSGVRISGNSRRLAQVFRNILNNAIEASLEKNGNNRPVVYVTSSIARDSRRVEISFKDEGAGIDPHIRPRIMEAGVSTKKDSPTPNRGLGLYIAKHLIALHGGEISFTSIPNEGTTVRVALPLAEGRSDR